MNFIKKTAFLLLTLLFFFNAYAIKPSDVDKMSEKEKQWFYDNAITFPAKYKKSGETPKEYIIQKYAAPDSQTGFECSGCSIGYLMRFYGQQCNGVQLYHSKNFPCKWEGGAYPKVFEKYFAGSKFTPEYYTGSVDDLKNAVAKGIPVIILTQETATTSHYLVVTGFDSKYIYLQDSVPKWRNVKGNKLYNRKVEINKFKQIWKSPYPYCSNLFVRIVKK